MHFVLKGFAIIDFAEIISTTFSSVFLSLSASIFIMLVSVLMIVVANYKSSSAQRIIIYLSSCGYAFPGTILAVGIVVFVGWLNDLFYFSFPVHYDVVI